MLTNYLRRYIIIKNFFHLLNMKQFFLAAFSMLFIAMISQTACYYDNEQDLYGTVACDTTAISYATDIRPILDANCISCHAPGGEQEISPLLTYDDIKRYTDANNLSDRINGRSSLMPPTAKMSTCNIAIIEAWINQGALDN